ncbi:hypothetical protein COO91_10164 (plasmid) [Nostoc flagelliforme CCNUN1]|uniref:Uncharacterized protein n=1 Tax=Nostoc flagelliforme CCNUN1 TaxID=2038116 RepID=A0A2K8T8H7_9NOSO|nr:hypothetical protein COO91_10164 [Nostoc flagelliforme CCNUN1]
MFLTLSTHGLTGIAPSEIDILNAIATNLKERSPHRIRRQSLSHQFIFRNLAARKD